MGFLRQSETAHQPLSMNMQMKSLLICLAFMSLSFMPVEGAWAQSTAAYERRYSGEYVVRRGDSLSSISRATGVPVRVILDLNPRLNPHAIRVGDLIILPVASEARRAWITIEPARGGPGTEIRVRAAGFRPNGLVRVLAGRSPYTLRPYGQERADDRGRVRTRVEVPEWLRPGTTYFVAVESANRKTRALSDPFRVTRRIDDDGGERIDVTGVLRDGPECPILRADEGGFYSLVGDLQDFDTGDHVRIVGRTVEVSICQRGITVQVRRIEEAD